MKHTMDHKLVRDIRRQWQQFVALAITVMFGIALYAAANNAYENLQTSYANAFTQENFADLFVTGGDIAAFSKEAEQDAGVAAVTQRQQFDTGMAVDTTKFTGRVISYPTSDSPAVGKISPETGAQNPEGSSVLVEQHMAADFSLNVGDEFTVTGANGPLQATVGGVVASAEYLWPSPSRQEPIALPKTFGVIFASPEFSAQVGGSPTPNQALVLLTDSARSNDTEVLATLTKQAQAAGAIEVLTRAEQPSNSLLQEDINGFEQMSIAFPLLFLSAAALATYVLLTRRVTEERPIVGMLRAQGMRGRTILAHYLKFGLAAALVGAIVGLPLGILGAGAMSRQYTQSIQLPESLVVIEPFRWQTIVVGLLFAVVAGTVASLPPAILASRIVPAEAMRSDAPATGGRLSLLERAIPPLQRAPARWRLVIRSISRHKKRATFTAIGVAMALLLTLVSGLMISTMSGLIDQQFNEVEKNQGQVQYDDQVGPNQLERLTSVPSVTAAESVMMTGVAVSAEDTNYATSLTGFDQDTQMHGFVTPQGEVIELPNHGVLISQSITSAIPDLAVGDPVTLRLADAGSGATNQGVAQVTVTNFVNDAVGTFVYADKDFLTTTFGAGAIPTTTALIQTTPDADQDAVQKAVSAQPGVVAYVQTGALAQMFDEFAGLFYVFVGAMLVLGGLMAFAIIFTTMSVNIMERQRELATLRAAGVRQRTLAGLVGGENLIIATFGIIPGILLGIFGAQAMLSSYSNDQFTLNLVVSPLIVLLAVGAVLAVALLSQWPGLRAIRRMNIAQVVRERAN